ncbi:hypothetical protein RND81_11G233500 [Saponaria officinalis]|uniref:DNA-(apurinic or apyrimidinic site) endonuclease 2 n=1 Tax=Saponaria officinalis TaxID=3572 RepID=A0AAW1HR71_SAPOF
MVTLFCLMCMDLELIPMMQREFNLKPTSTRLCRWELLQQEKRRIIVVGDLNIAPFVIDRCDAGPDFEKNEFRIWLRSMFVKHGGSFLDVFRQKHPERKDAYTHWSVHNGAEEFNYGSRIDHIIASGGCFHHADDNEDHNLVVCHVQECDIMTDFRRWKPGMPSRWKGGKPTKLEGSDHVPVFATLKDLPDIQLHSTPSLSARYIPEIRGSQQTIVSVFMKRKMSEPLPVDVSNVPSLATEEDTKNIQPTLQSCTTSSVLVDETSSSSVDTRDYAFRSSKNTQDVQQKKKMKQNNKSQLSLTSFFQKVPVSKESSAGHSTKDASNNRENTLSFQDYVEELPEARKDSDIRESVLVEEENMSSANRHENDKKNIALLEWQRIHQLMQDSIPLCEGHREPCVPRVVKKPGPTFGRRFYVCARGEGPSSNPETRCDFFRWAGSKPKQKK